MNKLLALIGLRLIAGVARPRKVIACGDSSIGCLFARRHIFGQLALLAFCFEGVQQCLLELLLVHLDLFLNLFE